MSSITKLGYRLPRYRLSTDPIRDRHGGGSQGVKTKAVQVPDQDPVTLGVSVARDLLPDGTPDGLFFASSTPLYEYGAVTPTVVEALDLPEGVFTSSFSGSTRAGSEALRAAHHFADATGGTGLVVSAEAPTPAPGTAYEKTAGAGAAAAVIDPGDAGLAQVAARTDTRNVADEWQAPTERRRHTADDRYRREAGFVETVRTAATETVETAGWAVDDIDHFAVAQPSPRYFSRAVSTLDIDREMAVAPSFARDHGDLGAATPLVVLAHADLRPDDKVLMVGYGTGIADGFAYAVTDAAPAVHRTEEEPVEIDYLDYLQTTDNLTYDR
jgi:hydroxymethylglutaryl-CoA synthase